jgi:hypothetical protein
MVPASMFMYGSILMAVTLSPAVLSNRPVEEATADWISISSWVSDMVSRTDHALSDTAGGRGFASASLQAAQDARKCSRDDTTTDEDILCHGEGWIGVWVVESAVKRYLNYNEASRVPKS